MMRANSFSTGFVMLGFVVVVACSGSDPSTGKDGGANSTCAALHGPPMSLVATSSTNRFCIDRTEVTRAQYKEFLDSRASPSAGRKECETNTDRIPVARCLAQETPCTGAECGELPQVCVDFCDAEAYCAWAGKTLCGGEDGKELSKAALQTDWNLVWERACRGLQGPNESGTKFSYGNTFSASTCNASDRPETGCRASEDTCRPTAAGRLSECHGLGPYAEIFDLDGNAAEFIYSVVPSELDGRPLAQYAGSDYISYKPNEPIGCFHSNGSAGLRLDEAREFIGFRCCKGAQ